MRRTDLFPANAKVGVFRGFQDGGMEFRADLTLPHRPDFQNRPMHGQFVLVELDNPDEAVLGRIASLSSDGKLAYGSGEEYNIRAVQENRPVPEDILTRYLRYRVNIRVLGVLRNTSHALSFVPSLRRLPPAGSAVAFPSGAVLQEITGHHGSGATIGHFALGEYFFGPEAEAADGWMRPQPEHAAVKFAVNNLVSRRSFIFARAGFGKSNLAKLLFSSLYRETPTVTKRRGIEVPVGTVLFDPDGEYFWPDDKGRPGFCDVDGMAEQLVVFTDREAPSRFYGSFVAAGTRLDLRRLDAAAVVGTFLSADRQQQQNVIKMRALNRSAWGELVDLVHKDGHDAELSDVRRLLKLEDGQEAEALAARANAVRIVRALHDPSSLLLDMLMAALRDGKLCVVDVSQKSQEQALVLSGLILHRIFVHNQNEFTSAEPKTIPTIAVVEEAQAVLNERAAAAQPYIAWVKEGRKYDLGAVLVTQQPGSIPNDILSQGDNWFLFHLLSAGDLQNVRSANAHFGQDLLASLLNEPIPGQGVFWSSAGIRQYPIPLRVRDFESQTNLKDPSFDAVSTTTYAGELSDRVRASVAGSVRIDRSATRTIRPSSPAINPPSIPRVMPVDEQAATDTSSTETVSDESSTKEIVADATSTGEVGTEAEMDDVDVVHVLQRNLIASLRDDPLVDRIRGDGVPWGGLNAFFRERVPEDFDDADEFAYHLVRPALDEVIGPQDQCWETFKNPKTGRTWVRAISQQ